MNLTRKQKIYAVALTLAMALLVVDRTTQQGSISGPATSSASLVSSPTSVKPTETEQVSPADAHRRALALRLDRLAQGAEIDDGFRDAFAVPQAWRALREAEKTQPTKPSRRGAFKDRRQLTAVMIVQGGGIAMIDGMAIRVGQSIDGYRLVSVGQRSAKFTSVTGTVELFLPDVE